MLRPQHGLEYYSFANIASHSGTLSGALKVEVLSSSRKSMGTFDAFIDPVPLVGWPKRT